MALNAKPVPFLESLVICSSVSQFTPLPDSDSNCNCKCLSLFSERLGNKQFSHVEGTSAKCKRKLATTLSPTTLLHPNRCLFPAFLWLSFLTTGVYPAPSFSPGSSSFGQDWGQVPRRLAENFNHNRPRLLFGAEFPYQAEDIMSHLCASFGKGS